MSCPPFPVLRLAEVAPAQGRPNWLVESLWARAGTGVLGANPKSGKTWLALDMAVSVASGTRCLDHFPVLDPGPVLLFLAEDSAANARERVSGICHHRDVELGRLDLFLLTTPVLRLDRAEDVRRLTATVEQVKPRLLVLDPFVRIQCIEENSASEVSRILGELTALQRSCDVAVLLVHHTRKGGAGHPGQALRGSGDLRAWGDSNLFLTANGKRLVLSGEHRAAAPLNPVTVKLVTSAQGAHPRLTVSDAEPAGPPELLDRVMTALEASPTPLTRTALRRMLAVNNQRLGEALLRLERSGQILRTPSGWQSFRSQSRG